MVKMLGSYVLIRKEKPVEKKSPGGIVIPQNAQAQSPAWGAVIGVGPEVSGVAVGDRVLMGKYSGSDVVVDDEPCVVVRLEDVYGVEIK